MINTIKQKVSSVRKRFFPQNRGVIKKLPFTYKDVEKYIRLNRETLNKIDNWIDERAFVESFFQYGVPDSIRHHINAPLSNNPTYTDYIVFIAQSFFKQINYLEIGVSVGKNFFQLLNCIANSKLTGFDIEEINPVLQQQLDFKHITHWDTMKGSLRSTPSSLSTFIYKTNIVEYVAGDVWDVQTWNKLQDNKYNIIFSDALHDPKAILLEFEMILQLNLLADKFIVIWDDLVEHMQPSFFEILRKHKRQLGITDAYLLDVNGWIGDNEEPHKVGILSNFSLKK